MDMLSKKTRTDEATASLAKMRRDIEELNTEVLELKKAKIANRNNSRSMHDRMLEVQGRNRASQDKIEDLQTQLAMATKTGTRTQSENRQVGDEGVQNILQAEESSFEKFWGISHVPSKEDCFEQMGTATEWPELPNKKSIVIHSEEEDLKTRLLKYISESHKDGKRRILARKFNRICKATLNCQSDIFFYDGAQGQPEVTHIESVKTPNLTLQEQERDILYHMLEPRIKESEHLNVRVSNSNIAYKISKLLRYLIQAKTVKIDFYQGGQPKTRSNKTSYADKLRHADSATEDGGIRQDEEDIRGRTINGHERGEMVASEYDQ